jgi:hypothetical protein
VNVDHVNYKGKAAIPVTDAMDSKAVGDEDRVALLTDTNFRNGTFVGIAFRVAPDVGGFECFCLRPTNGRTEDQIRPNHSAQYVSFPEFPWYRLRKEFPENLIVNDLKQGTRSGAVGLWIGPGAIAHFANLKVSR